MTNEKLMRETLEHMRDEIAQLTAAAIAIEQCLGQQARAELTATPAKKGKPNWTPAQRAAAAARASRQWQDGALGSTEGEKGAQPPQKPAAATSTEAAG